MSQGRKRDFRLSSFALAWVLALGALPALADSRRLAIVVGNNAGSGAQPPLRYAESDAGKVARVLVELGDVMSDDLLLLQGRSAVELEQALTDARERITAFRRAPETRVVLLFYFSGHSDGESIELGREKLPYGRLKALLAGTGAELRVAIVDACKSGSAILSKGGRRAEPFTIKLTDALIATGDAFISSSAADEAALESSEVMGSFFTHNLVSGLRGAADTSGDKLVTLSEAYRFAYDRTVYATAMMPVSGQHPSYDYRLSGQGELVLSSLLRTSATLVLPEGAERSLVTDLVRDQVAVELPRGPAREVALAPGKYGVRLIRNGQSFAGRVALTESSRVVIGWKDLVLISSSVEVAAKGGTVESKLERPGEPWLVLGLAAGGMRGITLGGVQGALRVSVELSPRSGLSFALIGATGNSAALEVSESLLQLRAGYRLVLDRGPVSLIAGLEAGPAMVWQTVPSQTFSSFAVGAGPRLGLRLRVATPLSVSLEGEAPVLLVRIDDQTQALVLPSVGLGLALTL